MRLHFIAIGGSIMHQLAIALHLKGDVITGSDDEIFDPAKGNLTCYGLLPDKIGWDDSRIDDSLDGIILGMHARKDNPELVKAQELDIPIYSFPEFVYNHSKDKLRVAIAGSHGKTSITSMIIHVLTYWNSDFDYLVGAQIEGFDQVVKLTNDAKTIVMEGDEYLSSPLDLKPKIHWYKPQLSVISGIAWDHINVFPTEENYIDQFRQFLKRLPNNALVFYYQNDNKMVELVNEFKEFNGIELRQYGVIDYKIINNTYHLIHEAKEIPVQLIGKHNMENLEAARLICNQLKISDDQFYNAIPSFQGAAKRMETIYKSDTQLLIRDFAHAPSKLRATISAVRENFPNRKLVAIMELHTYSSLDPHFLSQYKNTMNDADEAVVFVDNHAIELKRKKPLSNKQLQQGFEHVALKVLREKNELTRYLKPYRGKEVNVLFMSSGNFNGFDFEQVNNGI